MCLSHYNQNLTKNNKKKILISIDKTFLANMKIRPKAWFYMVRIYPTQKYILIISNNRFIVYDCESGKEISRKEIKNECEIIGLI